MKNKIKEFVTYIESIGGKSQKNWLKYSYEIKTIYGTMRASIHESDFTEQGVPRKKFDNLVSIYTSFVDFDKALPYLERKKHPGDGMPVLNSKMNYHLSGGNCPIENWNSQFENFKSDLNKILVRGEKLDSPGLGELAAMSDGSRHRKATLVTPITKLGETPDSRLQYRI